MLNRQDFSASALNLACYLAKRQYDLRDLQLQLMPWGLSSIGRSESRMLETLDNVISTLKAVADRGPRDPTSSAEFFRGDDLLELESERVLGPLPANRRTRIMVTLQTEAAARYEFVRDTLARGMNVARINCAHDTREDWLAMIEHIRQTERETGHLCKISMDLAGPKIRVEKTNFKKKHRFVKNDVVVLVHGQVKKTASEFSEVKCTLEEPLAHIQVGDQVWFDDGLIGACAEEIRPEGVILRIDHVSVEGERIRPEKGINFPDTELSVSALTAKDLEDLDFVVQYSDVVNFLV